MTLIVSYLRRQNVLSQIEKQVHFARRRFGQYDVIDFVAVLLGYAISGERTLEAFSQRVSPFASTFMALFERDRLPARSTLSRFLAALTPEPLEALRALFLSDLLARPLVKEGQPGGGKCPEISTDFALKHAHLPRIVSSTTIDCLENRSKGDCKLSMIVNTDRPGFDFCAPNVRTKRWNCEPHRTFSPLFGSSGEFVSMWEFRRWNQDKSASDLLSF